MNEAAIQKNIPVIFVESKFLVNFSGINLFFLSMPTRESSRVRTIHLFDTATKLL